MFAVVLAAGEGKRIRSLEDRPKGLIRLLGLTILERIILSLREVGIRDLLIIVGYKGQLLRESLGDGRRFEVNIKYIENKDWQRGNGISLFAAKEHLAGEEKFLVLMSDHIFQPLLIERLIEAGRSTNLALLCTDRRFKNLQNLPDATKVSIGGDGLICDIGKGLSIFNGVDCGIFLMTQRIFESLESAILQGRFTLTDGVRGVVSKNLMKSFPIGNSYWQDIDTEADLRVAEEKLLNSLRSPKDGFISSNINRRFSLLLTRKISSSSLSPNLISFLSFILGVGSAALFAFGIPILAGIMAQLSSVIDGVDGELARIKFQSSIYGGYFDSILDRYADALIILGMSYYLYSQSPSLFLLLISALALIGSPMSMLTKEKYHALTGRAYIPQEQDGWMRLLPANRDGRLFVIMLGGLFNLVLPALIILAVVTNLQTIFRFFSIKRAMKGQ
ncbi:NTP transferase domain-containing protein [candidate division NPL-UPA2 bacterium]|nr:NTP transferase domain-containing protein [candidate division NPL-UPA2 bacterium]